MTDADFGKPIIAVVNSFTQFVPGHVHLRDLGKLVAEQIEASGGVAKEFNTIAVDDGIAMGHGGMLYSLPSRELIADSVEYMVNAPIWGGAGFFLNPTPKPPLKKIPPPPPLGGGGGLLVSFLLFP